MWHLGAWVVVRYGAGSYAEGNLLPVRARLAGVRTPAPNLIRHHTSPYVTILEHTSGLVGVHTPDTPPHVVLY
jgi:hypothetical protein